MLSPSFERVVYYQYNNTIITSMAPQIRQFRFVRSINVFFLMNNVVNSIARNHLMRVQRLFEHTNPIARKNDLTLSRTSSRAPHSFREGLFIVMNRISRYMNVLCI